MEFKTFRNENEPNLAFGLFVYSELAFVVSNEMEKLNRMAIVYRYNYVTRDLMEMTDRSVIVNLFGLSGYYVSCLPTFDDIFMKNARWYAEMVVNRSDNVQEECLVKFSQELGLEAKLWGEELVYHALVKAFKFVNEI